MATTRTASNARFRLFNEAVIAALVPDALYKFATWDVISSETIDNVEGLFVFTLRPVTFSRENQDDNTDTAEILMQFGAPDNYESDSEEQTNLVESIEVLVEQYLEECAKLRSDWFIDYVNIQKESYFKQYGRNISGMYLRFTAQVNTCTPYTWDDMSDFAGRISKDVSPFDWSNYSEQE